LTALINTSTKSTFSEITGECFPPWAESLKLPSNVQPCCDTDLYVVRCVTVKSGYNTTMHIVGNKFRTVSKAAFILTRV